MIPQYKRPSICSTKEKEKCHNGQQETEELGVLTVVLSADKIENVE